ncbi:MULTISPECIES: hydrogenase maturation protease [Nocardioides]|uniref:hydrogenase maturation protease n=1 Tax=Nocardioides TaxID=1839 RepID=UPI00032FAA48|nr:MULTISPECIES: hydrogenase maturation protease [Nocardioides]EON22102.1 hydrogenase maturation protease [Nocardioides sp. CF8]
MAWSEPGPGLGAGTTHPAPPPHALLDDGFAPEACDLLVIGCGNILRGDDAVGPVLIRTLFTRGVPDGVRIVDGGTSGMDVAFGMRGARRVVIVDAAHTGAEAGTIYQVPAAELEELPPIDGLHTHNFRWDHALAFSEWLLGPERPTDITVFLVEVATIDFGAPLTREVDEAMHQVIRLIDRDFYPRSGTSTVEITDDGYLHLGAELANARFPADVCVASFDGAVLELIPLIGAANGGLVLRQRNAAGDRTVLIHEVLGFRPVAGRFSASWDDAKGVLSVQLVGDDSGEEDRHGTRGDDRGDPGVRPVDGLPLGDQRPGSRATSRLDPQVVGAREPGGRRDSPNSNPASRAGGGQR